MVNFQFNLVTLSGLLSVFLAFFYLAASVIVPVAMGRDFLGVGGIAIYIAQALIAPLSLFLSGLVAIFYGWRYDPVMQAGHVMLFVLVILLLIKDILMSREVSRRRER